MLQRCLLCRTDDSIRCKLQVARQRNWFQTLSWKMPSEAQLLVVLEESLTALSNEHRILRDYKNKLGGSPRFTIHLAIRLLCTVHTHTSDTLIISKVIPRYPDESSKFQV